MKETAKNKFQVLIFLFLVAFFQSCQYFEKKVPTEKELLEKQLKQINWNEVDEYPSFSACDSVLEINLRKQCFFDFLTTTIQERIKLDKLHRVFPKLDTVKVKVTVFSDANIQFETQLPLDSLSNDGIKIDSILHSKLVDFPKINPALKRGIPVKSQFIIPVVIASK